MVEKIIKRYKKNYWKRMMRKFRVEDVILQNDASIRVRISNELKTLNPDSFKCLKYDSVDKTVILYFER